MLSPLLQVTLIFVARGLLLHMLKYNLLTWNNTNNLIKIKASSRCLRCQRKLWVLEKPIFLAELGFVTELTLNYPEWLSSGHRGQTRWAELNFHRKPDAVTVEPFYLLYPVRESNIFFFQDGLKQQDPPHRLYMCLCPKMIQLKMYNTTAQQDN